MVFKNTIIASDGEFLTIKRLESGFMVLDNEEESNVPLHRIKKVMKKDVVVWERK